MKISKNWQLKILFIIGFGPALLAWFIAGTGFGLPDGTKNNGQLMSSGLVVPKGLSDLQHGRWGLMLVGQECEKDCKEQLVVMQQVHKALGKEFNRLQSIWLKKSDHELFPPTNEPQEMTQVTEEMALWLTQNQLPADDNSIWLIDPLGNLVIRFSPEISGKEILADILWLLKVSQIG
ncbi:hypothetical protein A9Q99_16890 [Gammaproteobacteria bacterium 45_16_T64]|nr:hypothetical protein A9Q99_16890 [Gammaproteobacteria bacterium 45_16_T64]